MSKKEEGNYSVSFGFKYLIFGCSELLRRHNQVNSPN